MIVWVHLRSLFSWLSAGFILYIYPIIYDHSFFTNKLVIKKNWKNQIRGFKNPEKSWQCPLTSLGSPIATQNKNMCSYSMLLLVGDPNDVRGQWFFWQNQDHKCWSWFRSSLGKQGQCPYLALRALRSTALILGIDH